MALPGYPKADASNETPLEFTSEHLRCGDVQKYRLPGEALVKRHAFFNSKES